MARQVDTLDEVDLVDWRGESCCGCSAVGSLCPPTGLGYPSWILDSGSQLLFLNFSVEMPVLPGIVLTPLWRRKLGLKGTNGS
jgi:hypothetical protein